MEEHFRHTVFSLLVLLCCGENAKEKQIVDIKNAQRRLFKSYPRFEVFVIIPKLGKLLFRKL